MNSFDVGAVAGMEKTASPEGFKGALTRMSTPRLEESIIAQMKRIPRLSTKALDKAMKARVEGASRMELAKRWKTDPKRYDKVKGRWRGGVNPINFGLEHVR